MASSTASLYSDVDAEITQLLPELVAFRRDLHAHPELAYQEVRTAGKVIEVLRGIPGLDLRIAVAGTGIVATLGAHLPGPTVALRADMDALPMEEQSGVAYASKHPGVAHACGHDGHTTMLLGAVQILAAHRDELAGPVTFIFQPAEEGGAGGQRMTAEGALENPRVAAIFGLHNMPAAETEVGQICLCPGAAMAGTATFTITLQGKGGHAAAPHLGIDPIYIGSQVVSGLQGIVSRSTDPIASVVISVTQFHAGSAYNVIPDQAVLRGTFRALDEVVLENTGRRIAERAEAIARAFGATAEVVIHPGYPVLRNHSATDALFREVVTSIGRKEDYREVPPIMGGEDFAYFQQAVPGTYWFLPARPAGQLDVPFCHHPAYDFNDAILADGIRIHVELGRRFARLWRG